MILLAAFVLLATAGVFVGTLLLGRAQGAGATTRG